MSDTRFKKGNQWWRQRTKHGVDALFSDPALLFEECCKYFENTDNRKIYKKDFKGNSAIEVDIPHDIPYTLSGLCLFLGITQKTWIEWRKERSDLSEVISNVDSIIYTNKFEGATTNIFNANIISRDLGLMDRQDVTTGGEKMNVISLGSGVKPPEE